MKKKQVGLIVILVVLIAFTALLGVKFYKDRLAGGEAPTEEKKVDVEWYDVNQKEFTITTADELYDVVTLSYFYDFKGQTIKLGADIVVNEGNAKEWKDNAPQRNWFPIQQFAGTFDGQGHTISGIYADTTDIEMGLFANTKEKCVIQDFKLVNSYFETEGDLGSGSIVSHGGGTFKKIYSDAIMNCDGGRVAGLFSHVVYDSTIEECWFDGETNSTKRFAGGIVDVNTGAKITIKHCLNTGTLRNSYTYQSCTVGGIVGATVSGGTLTVDDCLGVGKIDTINKVRIGSVIGGSDSNTITTVSNSFGSAESSGVAISTVISNLNGGAIAVIEKNLKGAGGYQWTSLDFDKYWTTVTDGTPILQYFADEVQSTAGLQKCFDTSWYDEKAREFMLTTVEQMFGMTYLSVSTTFEGKVIKLGKDIQFNKGNAAEWAKKAPENNWIPCRKFGGTFDGQGHTISGLYFSIGGERAGLFSETTPTSVVKNLRITNSFMESTGGIIGAVAGRGKGRVDTVYCDAIVATNAGSAGGIVGQVAEDELVVTNCWFNGILDMTTKNGTRGGGIVGFILNEKTKVAIDNCLFTGTIKTERDDGFSNVGGIYGISLLKANITVKDCLSNGKFEVAYAGGVGTVVGHVGESTATFTNVYSVESEYPGIMYTDKTATRIGGAIVLPADRLVGVGGYQWTNLNFNKYWSAIENNTPLLKSFAGKSLSVAGLKKLFSVDWYDEKKTTYTLKTVEDLYGFMLLSGTTNFEGKTITLGADITLNTGNAADWANAAPENEWTPLQIFAGTFDGQGHTISGIYVNANKDKAGLFSESTPKATIRNFRIVNSYIRCEGNLVGSVVGRGNSKFDSIYSNAIISATGASIGGIVGQVQTGNKNSITNCWFDGKMELTEEGAFQAGGIVGFVLLDGTSLLIDNCLNSGSISSVRVKSASNVGGICGTVDVKASLILQNSVHTGTFNPKNPIGVGTAIGRLGPDVTVAIKETYGFVGKHQTIGILAGKPSGNATQYPEATLQGTEAYRMTALDFDKYWMAREGKTPILRTFGDTSQALSLAGIVRANTSWYDESKSTYTLSSADDLYGFAKLSTVTNFAGKTVKLGKDIIVNSGDAATWATNAPANVWVPIQNFAGTFDGQGRKISGIYLNSNIEKVGLFAETTPKATIKNLRLENSYMSTTSNMLGSIAGRGNGTFDTIYSDAIITSTGSVSGGLVGQINQGSNNKITNCWFAGEINLKTDNGQRAGGMVGFILGKVKLTINNCLTSGSISSERTSGAPNIGGFVGIATDTVEIALQHSIHTGTVTAANKNCIGTAIGNVGGATVNVEETYGIIGQFQGIGAGAAKTGGVALYSEKNLTDIDAYVMTGLDFNQYWIARKDKTPILKSFAKANEALKITSDIVRADTSWYDASASEYEISTANEFYGFAKLSQSINFAGKTVKLTKDISLNSLKAGETAKDLATKESVNQWMPIGKALAFEGTFDGQGHEITGLYVNETTDYAGLFGQSKGLIKNVSLKDSYVVGSGNMVGSIVGFAAGNVESIYSNAIVENAATLDIAKEFESGGIVGRFGSGSTATISNCWFDGTISSNNRNCGGIVGRIALGTKTVENCLNTKTVKSAVTGTAVWAGGIVGGIAPQTTVNATIKSCLNVGTVEAGHFVGVGSVVGFAINDAATTMAIRHTYATNQQLSNGNAMPSEGIGGQQPNAATLYDATAIQGDKAFKMTGLDFNNYWTAKEGKTPELKAFTSNTGSITTPATQIYSGWYNGKDGENIITTKEELFGFAQLAAESADNLKDVTIKLGKNITVNEGTLDPINGNKTQWQAEVADWTKWTPISKFAGTFDGQGHTINGIYVNKTGDNAGFFAETTADATVKNLRLENSYIKASGNQVGSIVGRGGGTFDTIYTNAIVESGATNTGGLAGQIYNAASTVSKFWFAGHLTGGTERIGGVVGYAFGSTATIEECLIAGKVNSARAAGRATMGGVLGSAFTTSNVLIKNSVVLDNVVVPKSLTQVGIVVGDTKTKVTCSYVYTKQGSKNAGTGTLKGSVLSFASNDAIKGTGAFVMNGLDFDNTWVVKSGSTPEIAALTTATGKLPTPATQEYLGWYDGGQGTYTIDTAAGLRGLSTLSEDYNFYGATIKLGSDITLNEGKLNPKGKESEWNAVIADWNAWTPVGATKLFNGTFDGQGYTIRGIYVTDSKGAAENSYAGLFAQTNVNAVIQNFRLEDSYIQGGGYYVGSIAAKSCGTVYNEVYSNAIVKGASAMVGGLVGAVQENGGTFTSCWYDGCMALGNSASQAGGLIGCVRNGADIETKIENCLNSGTISCAGESSADNIGGLVGMVRIGTPKLTIRHSLNAGTVTITGEAQGVGTLVGHVDSGTLDMNNTVYGISGSYQALGSSTTGASVTNAAVLTGRANLLGENARTHASGLDFNSIWVTSIDATPVLAAFAEEVIITADTSWYNASLSEFTLTTAAQLFGLAELSKTKHFGGKTIKLGADILLNIGAASSWASSAPANVWPQIGSSSLAFAGTFDGQGHTIRGLYVNETAGTGYVGMFSNLSGDARNFNVENSYFSSNGNMVGSIAGFLTGNLEKISSKAIVVNNAEQNVNAEFETGGLVGRFGAGYERKISNCWFDGSVTSNNRACGGVVGRIAMGTKTIEHCLVTGSVHSTMSGTGSWTGGLIGTVKPQLSGNGTLILKDSLNVGRVTRDNGIWTMGSIIGYIDDPTNPTVNFERVYASNESYKNPSNAPTAVGAGTVDSGSATLLAEELLKGDSAKTNAPNLLWDTFWIAITDGTPRLKHFEK